VARTTVRIRCHVLLWNITILCLFSAGWTKHNVTLVFINYFLKFFFNSSPSRGRSSSVPRRTRSASPAVMESTLTAVQAALNRRQLQVWQHFYFVQPSNQFLKEASVFGFCFFFTVEATYVGNAMIILTKW